MRPARVTRRAISRATIVGSYERSWERSVCAQSFLYMAFVLIVDSQAGVRQQVVRLLAQAGHRATAVATISEATSLLQAEIPDLLATDAVLADGTSHKRGAAGRSGRRARLRRGVQACPQPARTQDDSNYCKLFNEFSP